VCAALAAVTTGLQATRPPVPAHEAFAWPGPCMRTHPVVARTGQDETVGAPRPTLPRSSPLEAGQRVLLQQVLRARRCARGSIKPIPK
jgi:hypothetical protein